MADKTYPVADYDDVDGFMAAARAKASSQQKINDEAIEAATAATGFGLSTGFAPPDQEFHFKASDDDDDILSASMMNNDPFSKFSLSTRLDLTDSGQFRAFIVDHHPQNDDYDTEKATVGYEVKYPQDTPTKVAAGVASVSQDEVTTPFDTPSVQDTTGIDITSPVSSGAGPAHRVINDSDEDRENLAVFKTWGTPAARDKPGKIFSLCLFRVLTDKVILLAARVRRIILTGLPSNWCAPARVLSLVHGGAIESIHISTSGNAHVIFCEHEACKAFFEQYPNGIDLDNGKTIFVEMGKAVDVISSQLSFNLSVGSTRVVRAVGAEMDIGMGQLMKLASMNNRKVEKIIDTYLPGDVSPISLRWSFYN